MKLNYKYEGKLMILRTKKGHYCAIIKPPLSTIYDSNFIKCGQCFSREVRQRALAVFGAA